jgi:hypothetical protein
MVNYVVHRLWGGGKGGGKNISKALIY